MLPSPLWISGAERARKDFQTLWCEKSYTREWVDEKFNTE